MLQLGLLPRATAPARKIVLTAKDHGLEKKRRTTKKAKVKSQEYRADTDFTDHRVSDLTIGVLEPTGPSEKVLDQFRLLTDQNVLAQSPLTFSPWPCA